MKYALVRHMLYANIAYLAMITSVNAISLYHHIIHTIRKYNAEQGWLSLQGIKPSNLLQDYCRKIATNMQALETVPPGLILLLWVHRKNCRYDA